MKKDCCTTSADVDCGVTVKVDVAQIVKYACLAGILIVAIIFGAKSFDSYLKTINTD